jgi:hypothetical protein
MALLCFAWSVYALQRRTFPGRLVHASFSVALVGIASISLTQ